jgi:hypothetical protein
MNKREEKITSEKLIKAIALLVDKLCAHAAPTPVNDRPRSVPSLYPSNDRVHRVDMDDIRARESIVRNEGSLRQRRVQATRVALLDSH